MDIHSPQAILHAPARRPASPLITTDRVLTIDSVASWHTLMYTPRMRHTLLTTPSLNPNTAARSPPSATGMCSLLHGADLESLCLRNRREKTTTIMKSPTKAVETASPTSSPIMLTSRFPRIVTKCDVTLRVHSLMAIN
eukprot:458044-Amorphochlora_amoeboformis.AAC.2